MNVQKIIVIICLLINCNYTTPLQAQKADSTFYSTDTSSLDKNHCNKTAKIIGIVIPSAMITYGFISLGNNSIRQLDYDIQSSLEQSNAFWHTHIDDYLLFSPAVAAFGMKLAGVESTHKLCDMAIIYTLSSLLSNGIIYGTKVVVERERPDGSNKHSFPSGHTGNSFVAAEFLHQEYKDKSVWISVAGYGMATFIGVARIYNNKHWLSDVVAGAGIGILSTKIVYWIYPFLQNAFCKKDKQANIFILPSYYDGKLGLSFSYSF